KRHRAAAEALAALEARRRELGGRLRQVTELRAVAPLLAALDHAQSMFDGVRDAPLLPDTAASERAAAESGLAPARQDAADAGAEVERQRQRLARLSLDSAILGIAPAARRLLASAEAIDRHRAELAGAAAEVATESLRLTELAQRIDPRAFANFAANPATGDVRSTVSSVLARAPSPATRAAIDEAVRALERTGEALEQHREAAASEAATPNP